MIEKIGNAIESYFAGYPDQIQACQWMTFAFTYMISATLMRVFIPNFIGTAGLSGLATDWQIGIFILGLLNHSLFCLAVKLSKRNLAMYGWRHKLQYAAWFGAVGFAIMFILVRSPLGSFEWIPEWFGAVLQLAILYLVHCIYDAYAFNDRKKSIESTGN